MPAKDVIEIITYPNNPDGLVHPPLYPNAAYHIYDCVYYWPTIVDIDPTPLSFDIMVFSLSKLTGMAQSRLGWALVRDQSLAFGTIGPGSIETYGVAAEAQYRAGRIMSHLALDHFVYFAAVRKQIDTRWADVSWIFAQQPLPARFSLQSSRGFWIWIACNDPTDDCDKVFLDAGIKGRFAHGETGVTGYNRLSVMGRPQAWTVLVQRLTALIAPDATGK
jgi:hypothetical protein